MYSYLFKKSVFLLKMKTEKTFEIVLLKGFNNSILKTYVSASSKNAPLIMSYFQNPEI